MAESWISGSIKNEINIFSIEKKVDQIIPDGNGLSVSSQIEISLNDSIEHVQGSYF